MICYEFKGGIGTASRELDAAGRRLHRRRAGAGQLRPAPPAAASPACRWAGRSPRRRHRCPAARVGRARLDHHRRRHRRAAAAAPAEAPRPPRGARPGAHRQHLRQRLGRHLPRLLHRQPGAAATRPGRASSTMLPNDAHRPALRRDVQATEEAIVNALVAAETMTGVDDHRVDRPAARPAARGAEEVQPAGARHLLNVA